MVGRRGREGGGRGEGGEGLLGGGVVRRRGR